MERTFFLLVLLGFSTSLFSSERYWFSYKVVTVNGAVIFQEKNITPIMTPFNEVSRTMCEIPLSYNSKLPKEQFLNENFDKLLPCFEGQPSHMLSWNEYHLKANNDRVEHIIEPVRFTVDFKDEFATINAIR